MKTFAWNSSVALLSPTCFQIWWKHVFKHCVNIPFPNQKLNLVIHPVYNAEIGFFFFLAFHEMGHNLFLSTNISLGIDFGAFNTF